MTKFDFDKAKQYALRRLGNELSPGLYYHGLFHTRNNIIPAIQFLAAGEGVQGEDLDLLLTAAWFHDIGFVETRAGHEAAGARIVAEVLPGFGYTPHQIQAIQAIIMATVLPQSPATLLEQIMADADLDVLGRADFMEWNNNLRRELAYFGQDFTDEQWLTSQLKFLDSHTYFTGAARARREAGQAKNALDLRKRIDALKQAASRT